MLPRDSDMIESDSNFLRWRMGKVILAIAIIGTALVVGSVLAYQYYAKRSASGVISSGCCSFLSRSQSSAPSPSSSSSALGAAAHSELRGKSSRQTHFESPDSDDFASEISSGISSSNDNDCMPRGKSKSMFARISAGQSTSRSAYSELPLTSAVDHSTHSELDDSFAKL